jgi:hypothetical protein
MTVNIGCHHHGRKQSVAIEVDSLSGIISITGTAFEQQLYLRSGTSATLLSAAVSDSAALSRLGGVEVRVVGQKTRNHFRVDRFTALSVAGSPVVDGVVRTSGSRLVLETPRGTMLLGNPSAGLRALNGARVWVGGPLDTGPNTYGVIVPAR